MPHQSVGFVSILMKSLVVSSLLLLCAPLFAAPAPAKPGASAPPANSAAQIVTLREGSGKPISGLQLSRDGQTAFVTASENQVEVFDLAARKKAREFRGAMGAYELAVSPDAQEIAAATIDFAVSIHRVANGTQRTQFGLGAVGGAQSLDWSADGKMIASASSNQVGLFDRDGTLLAKREGAIGVGPNVVLFSPDGKLLVAGWSDRSLVVYDTANFEKTQFAFQGPKLVQVANFSGHEGAVTALAWSKNGQFLASGDASGVVKVWEFETQKRLGSWTVADSPIESLSWAPSGASIAIATQSLESGAAVQVWDVAKNKAKLAWKHRSAARHVAFMPDGKTLVVGDVSGAVSLVPVALLGWFKPVAPQPPDLSRPFFAWPGNLETAAIAWSSDGKLLASAGATQLQVRDLRSGASVRVPQNHLQQITHVAFSPDSALLATSGYAGLEVADIAARQMKWKRDNRAVIAGFSRDGATLYVAEKIGQNRSQIAALDARSGALQKIIGRSSGTSLNTPIAAHLSPDGTQIAVAVLANYTGNRYTTMLEVWDIAGASLKWGSSLNGWSDAFAWSRDGKWIVAKSGDRAMAYPNGVDFVSGQMGLKWHDAANGNSGKNTRLDFRSEVKALIFSPDGERLLVALDRGAAQVWKADETFQTFQSELANSDGNINAWSFSPDAKHLAAGGQGALLRVWTPPNGF